jgi:hypothetical protein
MPMGPAWCHAIAGRMFLSTHPGHHPGEASRRGPGPVKCFEIAHFDFLRVDRKYLDEVEPDGIGAIGLTSAGPGTFPISATDHRSGDGGHAPGPLRIEGHSRHIETTCYQAR